MKKKILWFFGLLLVSGVALYFYVGHAYIYYVIGRAKLPVMNSQGDYSLGMEVDALVRYSAIGDSLTFGLGAEKIEDTYPYRVAEYLADKGQRVQLTVSAFPGARSFDVLKKLLDEPIKKQAELITILIGVNDIHGGISLSDFLSNYQKIISRLKNELPGAKIAIVAIPRLGANNLLWPPFNYYFRLQTVRFNKALRQLAEKQAVSYIDLDTPTKQQLKTFTNYYSADGFHPSVIGYQHWATIIYDILNR
ncbi:hypothetical protein COT94_01155 [Candidatus Falkowbacteria bacterium CG10_big_fil_rev_8_21_14_0_10_37_14]|uniref:SGNH hydrolase-type esterase domain-containing protein n=1 Tax=Candidatus Falkowbacteria bacterium CG10_big_fil_rev_8_21_14_0_10_37_14 TaxID=1974561 RepID=A0A2M6WU10_9BACT|nr:SGNH/GDSL hydrolase family protein [Candidatus Falkowbacteria bacterium]PIT96282.1 MAG: hypothetical protein COT94_01155 [Candidatus Falkowbacteria bacterium CG10_big_fil_rev_8_21_14_0_10_37_14]